VTNYLLTHILKLEETGVRILEVDYLDESTIETAANAYGNKPLDMLINVAGISPHPKPWQEQTGDMMVEKFRVMAVGPLLAIKHFLPSLERASDAKVVNISSAFGSISRELILTNLYPKYVLILEMNNRKLVWHLHGLPDCQVRPQPGRRDHGPRMGEGRSQGHHGVCRARIPVDAPDGLGWRG
jgi:hypothetical protein